MSRVATLADDGGRDRIGAAGAVSSVKILV